MATTLTNTNLLTIDQAINLCQTQKYSSYNLLQSVLHVIVAKLNLEGTVFSLEPGYPRVEEKEGHEGLEMYEILRSKGKNPIELKPIKPGTGVPYTETLVKVSQLPTMPEVGLDDSPIRRKDGMEEVFDTKLATLNTTVKKITIILDKLTERNESFWKQIKPFIDSASSYPLAIDSNKSRTDGDSENYDDLATVWKDELKKTKKEFDTKFCELARKVLKMSANMDEYERKAELVVKVKKVLDDVATKEEFQYLKKEMTIMCCEISKMQKIIGGLKSHVQDLVECAKYTDKRIREIEERLKIINKIREILERLESLEAWKAKIHDDLDRLTEVTEYLKIIKANREELDYIFEEKADRDELLKLVTLEFFKSVQDDLSSGIVQVLEQLMRNEIEWERAHKELQLMIDAKADQCEVTSIKRYLNCKLEIIQKKINDLLRNRLKSHASAVKIRLLKDARCITCTAEADLNQGVDVLPMLRGIKQYETRCICEPMKRYCGGSHTLVGPDQKLITKHKTRLQGAGATTLNYKLTEGTDGKLYRTRDQKCICKPLDDDDKEEGKEEVVKKDKFPC